MNKELGPSEGAGREWPADLVFDLSGIGVPDLGALCLMLTARNLVDENDQKVWIHGLPEPSWRLLHSLGLEHYFELLPQVSDFTD